jgi:hypothetical protein
MPFNALAAAALVAAADPAPTAPPPATEDAAAVLCGDPCPPACGPAGRFWVSNEVIHWRTSGGRLPPLLTTAAPGTPQATAGAIGAAGTRVVSDDSAANDFRTGYRLTAGAWLNADRTLGVEGDFFFLGQSRRDTAAGGGGRPGDTIVSRPFTNALTGAADAELVAFPGVLAGRAVVTTRSDLIGGGVVGLKDLCCSPCGRLDAVIGYRTLHLTDELIVREDLTSLSQTGVVPGTKFLIEDQFRTENHFHGGVVGLAGERRAGRLFVSARATVALGNNHRLTEIAGGTTIIPPGGTPQRFAGGLFAQPSNIGRYSDDAFAVVPEGRLRLGYQVTDRLRAFVGYTFLYMSLVARPGDQIDTAVNPTQLPPAAGAAVPPRPAFQWRSADFWAQGVSLGVEGRF